MQEDIPPVPRGIPNTTQRGRDRAKYPIGLLTMIIPPAILFVASYLLFFDMPQTSQWWLSIITALLNHAGVGADGDVDLSWHPPRNTSINDLATALHGTGVYGFIFNSSHTPDERYGAYNWCNMPHVRKTEYRRVALGYELRYVEVIQRHHKRTPYASNAFPVESYHWDCDDEGLFYYGAPFFDDTANNSSTNIKRPTRGYWKGFTSTVNPFVPSGWIGTCQFPQITAAGLEDSYVHGEDIYGVYHDLLGFFPSRPSSSSSSSSDQLSWHSKVIYRVTQNVITSQVAGMLVGGTWQTAATQESSSTTTPFLIAAAGIDSLEPQYPCPAGSALFNAIKSAADAPWQAHLDGAVDLYALLDDISGVSPSDAGFHASFDHYFDNLSARQCHGKALPCKLGAELGNDTPTPSSSPSSSPCIDQALADAVYRLGQWEYSRMYRDSPDSLAASVASYGVWIAELASHLRATMSPSPSSSSSSAGNDKEEVVPLYFHNVAHDGSVSRVLSILQIDVMVWPGMGSEVVFELYERTAQPGDQSSTQQVGDSSSESSSGYYVRVLFGGQVLRSSNPSLGVMDMLPVETLVAYLDGLVGENASLVVDKCNEVV